MMDKEAAEYARRNLLHAKAVGASAGVGSILKRLESHANPPGWLIDSLDGVLDRINAIEPEMAKHRDEVVIPRRMNDECAY